mmetsp:Transcript_31915/g.95327  ORF Transcript_31915/g.95327 Transcript_31915/m.95327 type:complete len:182 (-) Transcript_31915:369-914(-)
MKPKGKLNAPVVPIAVGIVLLLLVWKKDAILGSIMGPAANPVAVTFDHAKFGDADLVEAPLNLTTVHLQYFHVILSTPPNAKERYTCENSVNVYPALLEAIDLGRELPNHCARVPGGVVHSVYPKLNALERLDQLSDKIDGWAKSTKHCGRVGFVHPEKTVFYTGDGADGSIAVPALVCKT